MRTRKQAKPVEVPTSELERIQHFLPTTDRARNQNRLRMLKALAAETLSWRRGKLPDIPMDLACDRLAKEYLNAVRQRPDERFNGYTVTGEVAVVFGGRTGFLHYHITFEFKGIQEL